MEKEMEAENSDVSQQNENSDSQTNLSSLEQAKLAKESENETKYQQQLQQQQKQTENVANPSILKPTKSVSFEEPTVVNSDEENNNSIENKSLKNEKNIEVTTKKSKYPITTPAVASLEIGTKRDKRNRVVSIKPMFGPEGKYSDYKYTTIPDEITNNNYTNPTNNKTRTTSKSLKHTKHCADETRSDSDDDFDSGYPSRKLSETLEDCKNKNDVEESLVSSQVVSTHSHSRRKKAKSKYTKKQSTTLIANDDSNKRNDN
jgi:type III secretory pathway component EscV